MNLNKLQERLSYLRSIVDEYGKYIGDDYNGGRKFSIQDEIKFLESMRCVCGTIHELPRCDEGPGFCIFCGEPTSSIFENFCKPSHMRTRQSIYEFGGES